ncbi:MAG: dioxygenase, partial [Deltaproteobacteria bacterium]|nr:dioxygenase [Deltaproteobacteria bacterium]
MPVLFQAHGAPPLLDDAQWVTELADWAKALPRPKAIVVVSAHWEARPLSIGAAPDVAARLRGLMQTAGIETIDEPERGLDHGTYVPLMCMYPEAELPVLQISLPSMDPKELFAMGKALAPLRDEGVLVIGSGFITHNLRALSLRETPAWASDFDQWTTDVVSRHDHDALVDYRAKAPGVRESLPTHEHFVPLIVAAAAAPDARVTWPITGFWWGRRDDAAVGAAGVG